MAAVLLTRRPNFNSDEEKGSDEDRKGVDHAATTVTTTPSAKIGCKKPAIIAGVILVCALLTAYSIFGVSQVNWALFSDSPWYVDPSVDLSPTVKKDIYLREDVPHCTPVKYKGQTVCAPSFIVIGERKCATTTTFGALRRHPGLVASDTKEIVYFGKKYLMSKGDMEQYYDHWGDDLLKNNTVGEGSPQYFQSHPQTPQMIKHALPNVKLILLMRDPVERAWSDWKMQYRQGIVNYNFDHLVRKEAEHNRDCWDRYGMPNGENFDDLKWCYEFNAHYPKYLQMGHYAELLGNWYRTFPKEQILLLRSDEFERDPYGTLNKMVAYLDMPAFDYRTDEGLNLHKNVAKATEVMDVETQEFLTEYFRQLNDDLVSMLGPRFDLTKTIYEIEGPLVEGE